MAEVFNIDHETGDFSQYSSTDSGTLATFDVSSDAAQTGTYGMRCIGAGNGYGSIVTNSETQIYHGFGLYIDSGITMPAFSTLTLFQSLGTDFSDPIRLGINRESGSAGAPNEWAISDKSSPSPVSATIPLDQWIWCEIRFVVNSATVSGVEVWIDDSNIYSNMTQDYSADSLIFHSQMGLVIQGIDAAGDFIHFDNFIGDDSTRVPEPTVGVTGNPWYYYAQQVV